MKTNCMKIFRLFILFFLLPVSFYGQKTLTGLWTGTLSNDSSTIRKDQSFEIALTQYKEKVYGYSRSTFIVNDTLYYIMKRVKGTINGDVCEIKDDEIISYNFRGKIDKGVKVTTTFRMNRQDSSWHLAGEWTTNHTKRFYAVTGKVDLKDEPDMEKSKIFPHLEELDLAKEVPFYVEAKQAAKEKEQKAMAANTRKESSAARPDNNKSKPVETNSPIKKQEVAAVNKPLEENRNTTTQPQPTGTAKQTVPASPVRSTKTEPVVVAGRPVSEEPQKQEAVVTNKPADEKKLIVSAANDTRKQDQPAPIVSAEPRKTEPVAPFDKPVIAESKKQDMAAVNNTAIAPKAAVMVNERKTAAPQEVDFKSDSLQLALYDNGEIDGDTVSILLNGDLILARQGLKASAIRKTIYIQPGQDEITLVLYAENLGKYPPNTGLLVVYDGEDKYQVRFSADLQQNASVIFRRKK